MLLLLLMLSQTDASHSCQPARNRRASWSALGDQAGAGNGVAVAYGVLVQVNVVVMRGVNDDEIADFVELTRHRAVNVRFIEYMPFDGNVWSDTKMVTYKQMMEAVCQRFPAGLQRLQVCCLSLLLHACLPT